jgi:hypothetical protein
MPITCPTCTHDKVCSSEIKNRYQVIVSDVEVRYGDMPGFSVRCDNYAEKPTYRPAQWGGLEEALGPAKLIMENHRWSTNTRKLRITVFVVNGATPSISTVHKDILHCYARSN